MSFSRGNCWHVSPVKRPLSVPRCQCAVLIRGCRSWLSVIQSVRGRPVASGYNLAVSSSTEVISHHFITSFHQPDSLSNIPLPGDTPKKPQEHGRSPAERHWIKVRKSIGQMEKFFLKSLGETNHVSQVIPSNLLHHILKISDIKVSYVQHIRILVGNIQKLSAIINGMWENNSFDILIYCVAKNLLKLLS